MAVRCAIGRFSIVLCIAEQMIRDDLKKASARADGFLTASVPIL